jgi:hypothetical protein
VPDWSGLLAPAGGEAAAFSGVVSAGMAEF